MALYLLPTPITEESLAALPEATLVTIRSLDHFIVERARTARHLIKRVDPSRVMQDIRMVELGEHSILEAEVFLLEAHQSGKEVGLMSEAGCPGVADPGAGVVAYAHRMGIPVKPLVGPSSLLLALMASGMQGQRFVFHGYLSPKRPELLKVLRRLEQVSFQHQQTQIFIETPYRSQLVVEVALEALQADTSFGVASDLTGAGEWIRSLPVGAWRKMPPVQLPKAPAVFLIYRGNRVI
jgi:16S rRNA (cytidine1402-2'-O)-methyltransferase